MKKFVFKSFSFILLIVLICSLLAFLNFKVVGNQYSEKYTSSINEKLNRLRSIESPKIIIVGNSSAAFGFNSEMIENELKMNVVNLGLHGDLGNRFHEQLAKYNINNGDLVILCNTNYDDVAISNYSLAWITIEKNINLYKTIHYSEYWNMLKAYPKYFIDSTKLWISGEGNKADDDISYLRSSFNRYGDIDKRTDEVMSIEKIKEYKDSIKVPELSKTCIEDINKFNDYIEKRGAKLLISSYPIVNCEYTPTIEEYDEFEKELINSVDCSVISSFKDYIFPIDYFYDTHLHLTENGAKERTEQLIEDIKNWMNNN